MNQKTKHDSKVASSRFTISLALKNFMGKKCVGLIPVRLDLDRDLVQRILSDAGYSRDHPDYRDLEDLVLQTFTLEEISMFLQCLQSIPVEKVNIQRAFLRATQDAELEQEGEVVYYPTVREFTFSQLERYSLPFTMLAIEYPYEKV
jgi:hypothetical protein